MKSLSSQPVPNQYFQKRFNKVTDLADCINHSFTKISVHDFGTHILGYWWIKSGFSDFNLFANSGNDKACRSVLIRKIKSPPVLLHGSSSNEINNTKTGATDALVFFTNNN